MAIKITDSKVKSLKYKDIKSMSLGDRLNIKIDKNDNKYFFYLYALNGKRNTIGIGSYPSVSLKQARDEAFKYNQMLASGKDPKLEKAKAKYQDCNIFELVGNKALETKHPSKPHGWKSEEVYTRNLSIYNRFILPSLKTFDIKEIEPYQIAGILETTTPSYQRKIKNLLNIIFNYAVGKGITRYNIARDIQAEKESPKGFEFIHPTEDRYNFSKLLNDIDNYKGQYNTAIALKLAVLVGFRPSNIVGMKWEDIQEANIDGKKIPFVFISADNMKMSRDFRQPLSKQAYKLLMEIKEYNGGFEYVFHSLSKKKHITIESLSKALRDTLGYNGTDKPKQHTHGFRKSVRTYISNIRSKYNWCSDSIRMILSHSKENAIDNIYDKNDFLSERSQMLQLWADYVDEVKVSSNVINMDNVS